MTSSTQLKSISILRIAIYSGTAALSLAAAAIIDSGAVLRVTLLLLCLALCAVGTLALYRFADAGDDRQLKAERFAAASALAVLCILGAAIHLDRLFRPAPSGSAEMTAPKISPELTAEDEADESERSSGKEGASGRAAAAEKAAAPGGQEMPPHLARRVDEMLMEANRAAEEGKTDDADGLMSQVIETMDAHAPGDLPQRGRVVGALARLRFSAGKKAEGVDVIDQHILRLEGSDATDPEIVVAFHELAGALLSDSGVFEEAITRFRKVYEIQTRIAAAPARIADTHTRLALSYAELNDKSTAKQELDRAREILETTTPRAPEAMGRLEAIAKEYNL